MGEVAERAGVPRAQVALAWLLSKPDVTSPILGVSKMNHLDDGLEALCARAFARGDLAIGGALRSASGAGDLVATYARLRLGWIAARRRWLNVDQRGPIRARRGQLI